MAKRKDSRGPSVEADAKAEQRRKDADLADKWLKAIKKRRGDEENWRTEKAPAVIGRYRDDRKTAADTSTRFNIFWANVEILKPAILAKMPVPDCRRRYATKDSAARTAALILERSVSYCMEQGDLEDTLDRANEDTLLPGRAAAIVRYKPTIDTVDVRTASEPLPDDPEATDRATSDDGKQYAPGTQFDAAGAFTMQPREDVIYHEVSPEYVPWDLFVFGQAKTWRKVPWVATGSLLSKSEVKQQYKHLTDDQISRIQFTHSMRESKDGDKESGSFALFWDVWDKLHRKFMVFAEGYTDAPIFMQDDPLKLEGFYPIPEPIYAIRTNQNWTPKPEFLLYQDQANELDEAVERLTALTAALKVRGVYDKAFDNEEQKSGLSGLLKAADLTLIGIDNFRALVEKGGLKAIVDTLPLAEIAAAIDKLRVRVADLRATIDEVTGISDIVRGTTVASETLGAQQLKAQYSGLRISRRQQRMARFCRDIFRIVAEIIAEHFDPKTLQMISGIQVLPDAIWQQQKAEQKLEVGMVSESEFASAIQILRSDKLRGFKVEVEADSTIPADKEAEQGKRVEFITAVSQYLSNVMPAVQAGLIPAAVAREGLLFGVRGFKVGSEFEEVLEQLGQGQDEESIRKSLAQTQQQAQQLSEENAKLKDDNQKLQSKQAVDLQKAQTDAQIKETSAAHDASLKERDQQHSQALDVQQQSFDQKLETQQAAFKQQLDALSARFEQRMDLARSQPIEKASKVADSSSKQIAEVVKTQKGLIDALSKIGEMVALLHAPKPPMRRTGKMKLPSGGMAEFEIGDAEAAH